MCIRDRQELADATNDAEEIRALNNLHRMGKLREGANFPGVVRSIIENEAGISWRDLEIAVAP